MKNRELIVTADDLGIARQVNDGIDHAFKNGIVTTTSLLANGEAFDHAVNEVLPSSPDLPVGAHLNIMFGRPISGGRTRLADEAGRFHLRYRDIVRHFAIRPDKALLADVKEEFRAQTRRIVESIGRPLDHFNTQSHIHSIPAIAEIVCQVADEFDCPFVRNVSERADLASVRSLGRLVGVSKATVLKGLSSVTQKRSSIRSPGEILGIGYNGRVGTSAILRLVEHGIDGVAEICTHPGYPDTRHAGEDHDPWVAKWIQAEDRRFELEALVSWSKEQFEKDYDLRLVSFRKSECLGQG